jgi:hypothetical protein
MTQAPESLQVGSIMSDQVAGSAISRNLKDVSSVLTRTVPPSHPSLSQRSLNVLLSPCDEAKPGQILISARVLVAVEDTVKVEPVGEFELKGIRRPLAAYNVLLAIA